MSSPEGLTMDRQAAPSRRDWLGLGVLSAGLGLIVLDGTIVGVALPNIMADLRLTLSDAQWVSSIYAVILAALLLTTGRLADRWGRKRVFLAGLVVFAAGSALAAAAASSSFLLSARALQAVGAALIMPSTLSTVNAVFRGKYRATAFGVWGAVISGAAAIGPLAGGALTQWLSWHWIFLVNIPLVALIIGLAIYAVPETSSDRSEHGTDVLGAALSALGFGLLVFGIIEGPDIGWWAPTASLPIFGLEWSTTAPLSPVPIALMGAAISLVTFVAWESRRAEFSRTAILNVRLFKLPTFSWGNLTATIVTMGEFALIFVLPLFLINVLDYSVLKAGAVLAALAIGAFLSGAAARHLAAKFGAPETVLVGLALEVAGVVALGLFLSAEMSVWVLAVTLAIYGLGLGLASAQLTGTVLRDVDVAESGQASATQSTVRQIGSAVGTAISGAVLSLALALVVPSALASVAVADPVANQLTDTVRQSAGAVIVQLRAQGSASPFGDNSGDVIRVLSDAFASATQWSLAVSAIILFIGLIGAWKLRQASRIGATES
ncbi:MFS transporter [Neomicrococcus lactis]|uniref:EmrB/QacA subfamily drug resistance transporter n=1 Tax=Neomicrococcus lactis TaxID=732241 RepID=A0A7W8YA87_9MICC|nr:MFS transporter [Neomicrococcus lactis]MBB5597804.1 EmrB/QacA subfamily drug resistance transporter [Neomicrococcus lactis]